ncbi:PREDICTED: tyrosinase-like [Nanorana parkeri]|uniref:tyrosinase-like n=1 Tax=Nanorana parkeri TaxID=125878 RepID=UPI00085422EA|nr:PREDICTED: tyrosinase-like [Nanorana parkeri]
MKSMFAIAFFLLCLPAANGVLIPKVCVQGVTQWPVVCCPNYKTSRCGSALGRGNCLAVPASRSEPPPDITFDERFGFPAFFFNWTCQCSPKFTGYNCGECIFGWTGDNCNIPYTVTRRNILSLTPTEVETYLAKAHYCKSKIDPEFVVLRTADRFRKRSLEFIEASYLDVLAFDHYYGVKPFNSDAEEFFIINYAHGRRSRLRHLQ